MEWQEPYLLSTLNNMCKKQPFSNIGKHVAQTVTIPGRETARGVLWLHPFILESSFWDIVQGRGTHSAFTM
jgi:hypothetical protein